MRIKTLVLVFALLGLAAPGARAACVWCNPCMTGCYFTNQGATLCVMYTDACEVEPGTKIGVVCDLAELGCGDTADPGGGQGPDQGSTADNLIRPNWTRNYDWLWYFGMNAQSPGTNGDPDLPTGPTVVIPGILIMKDGVGVQEFAIVSSGTIPDGYSYRVNRDGAQLFDIISRGGDVVLRQWDGTEFCQNPIASATVGGYRVEKRTWIVPEADLQAFTASLKSHVRGVDLSLKVVKQTGIDAPVPTRRSTWGELKVRYH